MRWDHFARATCRILLRDEDGELEQLGKALAEGTTSSLGAYLCKLDDFACCGDDVVECINSRSYVGSRLDQSATYVENWL